LLLAGQFLFEGNFSHGRMEDGALVAVEGQRDSFFPEGVDHGGCVAFQGFGGAEDGGDEFTGGVVDDGMEGEERAAVYQPGEGGGFERWRNLFLNGGRMGIAWPGASLSKMMG